MWLSCCGLVMASRALSVASACFILARYIFCHGSVADPQNEGSFEMVYTGKPSMGCENCRKSKKRCDLDLPSCGRCVRLGKSCGGYRSISKLMFRDESEAISRRLGGTGTASSGTTISPTVRQLSPDKETTARKFFFDHFVTASHLSFLEGVILDELLLRPILACSMAVLANRQGGDMQGHELARRHYVEAITATNNALRHPQRVKADNTLISVFLLGTFERLNWDSGQSMQSWTHHVKGTSNLLQLRGRTKIRTRMGAALFRDLRSDIVVNALACETAVPEYVLQWTQGLEFDPIHTPADQLTILASRVASIKQEFKTGHSEDSKLLEIANSLEQDLLEWCESTLLAGSLCSFHNVRDLDSTHAWSGVRHEYGIPQAHRHWNMWRSLRIMLSRVQGALWRRSWPTLVQPSLPIPDSEQYKTIRMKMTADICVATAYAFGSDVSADPPKGSVSSAYLLLTPIAVAATYLLEQLAEGMTNPGGSRLIFVGEPLHLDPYNRVSTQLAWLIERLGYIADRVGIRRAASVSRFLKGECKAYYDLGRSMVVGNEDLEPHLTLDALDLSGIRPALESD